MKQTKKHYEDYLNALYSDIFSTSQAEDEFIYLTNKNRGNATNVKSIADAHANHLLGSLLRKYDPIAFNAGYNDWRK